ncbi:MAG: DUF177 domain-containing protein [Chloroflexi bacterium]|nr:DUF177 domain-containing protein [Chloroflexota bacterium]
MKFNVAQLLKDDIGSAREYPLSEPLEVPGEEPQPVSGKVRMLRTNRCILVRGRIITWVRSNCSRCLTPFSQEVQVELEEEFFPVIDVNSGVPVPVPSDASEPFTIDEHHILELTEVLRQDSQLALPMKPLCRPDCPGLCPRCGHNLNLGPCQCDETSPDKSGLELQRGRVGAGGSA